MGVLRTTTAAASGQTWSVRATATRIKSLTVLPNRAASATDTWVQLFNTGAPVRTGVITTNPPDAVVLIQSPGATAGFALVEATKIDFNGLLFDVGLSVQIASTSIGTLQAAAADLPDGLEVNYTEVA